MNILGFDTCLDKTYVTLYTNNKFINKVILSNEENYHSAYLISTIKEILKSNNLTPQDINIVTTDIGPGSFTGIRACVTVTRMLAQQLNIKAVGVSSLEILSKFSGENDIVLMDARKNKAYVYDKEILGAVELERIPEIIIGKDIICDNSMLEKFNDTGCRRIISYQQNEYQLGEILVKIALEKLEKNAQDYSWNNLTPLYIQPPPVFGK